MSEGIKAVLPVVSSHTTGGLIEELSLDLHALSEDIHGQRLGAAVDHLNCLFRGVNIDNGQNWTKYFFLHSGIIPPNPREDGQLHEPCLLTTCSSNHNLPLCLRHHGGQAGEVAGRHYSAIVRGQLWGRAIELQG